MIECPKCGGKIDLDDIYDIEEGQKTLIKKCVGHCLCCDTPYQWISTYQVEYLGTSDLHEC